MAYAVKESAKKILKAERKSLMVVGITVYRVRFVPKGLALMLSTSTGDELLVTAKDL